MAATTYRAFVTLAPKSVVVAATINGAFYFLLPSLDRFLARSYRETTPADVFIGHTLLHCITTVNYRANEGCDGAENTNVYIVHTANLPIMFLPVGSLNYHFILAI